MSIFALAFLLVMVLFLAVVLIVLLRDVGKTVGRVKNMISTIFTSIVETPKKTILLQLTLFLVMVATLILGIWVRLIGVGWFLVFSFIPLLFLVALHFMYQVWAILRISRMKPSYIVLILLSDLFFFLGFALQVDFGDQGGAYLAIVAFYALYFTNEAQFLADGQSIIFLSISIVFLISVIVSWFILLGERFLKQESID